MRFLVDLYRYIIFLFCALALIGAALVALSAADHSGVLGAALTGWMLFAVIAALFAMVLGLGGTAILVSIHDRHAELVEEADRIASAIERLATVTERGRSTFEEEL